jgi:hypothetical protein
MKKKPHNILFECYIVGLKHGLSTFSRRIEKYKKIEKDLDILAKKFGFSGVEYFDKIFDKEKIHE